jgi:hypothetical protein
MQIIKIFLFQSTEILRCDRIFFHFIVFACVLTCKMEVYTCFYTVGHLPLLPSEFSLRKNEMYEGY